MNKIILYITIFIFVISCSGPLKIGTKINNFQKSDTLLLSPLGDLIYSKHIVHKNIRYKLGIKKNIIKYVSTVDTNFKILNLKVGSTYKEIKKPLDTLIENPSFGNAYVRIKNNWYAGFKLDSLTENSKIVFFFKFKFSNTKEISSKNFKLSVPKGAKIAH